MSATNIKEVTEGKKIEDNAIAKPALCKCTKQNQNSSSSQTESCSDQSEFCEIARKKRKTKRCADQQPVRNHSQTRLCICEVTPTNKKIEPCCCDNGTKIITLII